MVLPFWKGMVLSLRGVQGCFRCPVGAAWVPFDESVPYRVLRFAAPRRGSPVPRGQETVIARGRILLRT